MALNLTVDLDNATFADLVALVEAARVAGVDKRAPLVLEDTTLHLKVEPNALATGGAHRAPATSTGGQLAPLGDAAIRSVIDILSGRQEPPRR
ncbi:MULTISPECIES: hypothetical protein [unclassified Corynebacterium]|uniref:hypothetical protein n=1 Tax=unclassified Corynebacterium TaxID=2624378 RepID=UPI002A90F958|nr:hypothetical protein [Corynebacterium sp.]MDY5785223.1 hypothetical protein [Corynebacterium sp.]